MTKKTIKNNCCWWCCHSLKDFTLSLPHQFNKQLSVYETYGSFCSWECMKAYSLNENDFNQNNRASLISMMFYDIYKYNKNIIPAPPRQCLKIFGGNLSIDEFRKNTIAINICLPPIIQIQHTFDKVSSKNYKFINNEEADKQFKNTTKFKINPINIKNTEKSQSNSLKSILRIS